MSYADVEDARLYDAQNPWGPADEFYLSLVRAAGDVLDVGCGTGLHARFLAERLAAVAPVAAAGLASQRRIGLRAAPSACRPRRADARLPIELQPSARWARACTSVITSVS